MCKLCTDENQSEFVAEVTQFFSHFADTCEGGYGTVIHPYAKSGKLHPSP